MFHLIMSPLRARFLPVLFTMPYTTAWLYQFTGGEVIAIAAEPFDQLQHMILASPPGTDFNQTAPINDHWDHRRLAQWAGRSGNQLGMTVGTKEIDNGIGRDFILGFYRVTSI
jgi:hypothetical protein